MLNLKISEYILLDEKIKLTTEIINIKSKTQKLETENEKLKNDLKEIKTKKLGMTFDAIVSNDKIKKQKKEVERKTIIIDDMQKQINSQVKIINEMEKSLKKYESDFDFLKKKQFENENKTENSIPIAPNLLSSIPIAPKLLPNKIPQAPNLLGGNIPQAPNLLGGTIPQAPNLLGGTIPKAPNLLGGNVPKAPNLLGGNVPKAPNLLGGNIPQAPSLLGGPPKPPVNLLGGAPKPPNLLGGAPKPPNLLQKATAPQPGIKKKREPKVPLKNIMWNTIKFNDIKQSIWEKIEDEKVKLDTEFLEREFAKKEIISTKNPGSNEQKKIEKITLLDDKRKQCIELILGKLRLSYNVIAQSLLDCNETILNLTNIESLINAAPKDDEIKAIKEFDGEKELLGNGEQFILTIMDIPGVEKRLFGLKFSMTYHELVFVNLREDKILKRVIELALAIGNYLNGTSIRGGAFAFKINGLEKFAEMKMQSRKQTLLAYIIEKIEEEEQKEVIDINESLEDLDTAAKVSLSQLQIDLNQIKKESRFVDQAISNQTDNPIDKIKEKLESISEKIKGIIKDLDEKYKTCENEFKLTCTFFCETGKDGSDKFLSFFLKFKKICIFNKKELNRLKILKEKEEEKKKQKEIEQEKKKKEEEKKERKDNEKNTNIFKNPDFLNEMKSRISVKKEKEIVQDNEEKNINPTIAVKSPSFLNEIRSKISIKKQEEKMENNDIEKKNTNEDLTKIYNNEEIKKMSNNDENPKIEENVNNNELDNENDGNKKLLKRKSTLGIGNIALFNKSPSKILYELPRNDLLIQELSDKKKQKKQLIEKNPSKEINLEEIKIANSCNVIMQGYVKKELAEISEIKNISDNN